MKYGEALPQRSVLEWLPFNLDYNEICDLIKKHTVGRIPVSNPNLKTDFDDELFAVLVEQLERIELFVKSKAGEIDRRIAQCSKTVAVLCQKDNSTTLSSKRLARYAKAEAELERAGYDIQCLSRYANVQYTGFKKLLKKYKKWTGSSCVNDRFLPFLESHAFHNRDFETHVLVLSELLAAVRSKFNETIETSQNGGIVKTVTAPPVTGCATAKLLSQMNGLKTRADLDMALGTNSPSNPSFTSGKGGKSIYWVHSDHLVEVQVLLLKHLNIQSSTPTSTLPPTPALSRKPSVTGISALTTSLSLTWVQDKVEDVGTVLLDNLPKFAQAQSSKTIEQAADTVPTAKIRWCGNDKDAEASIVVAPTIHESNHGNSNESEYYTLRLKRKHVETLMNINIPLSVKDQTGSIERIRTWFKDHPDIVPLVKILARRTRFVSGNKVWAVLDRDVRMYRLGKHWEGCISDPQREETGVSAVFPHAVLEVRWEGLEEPALVAELNGTHLVEVVHGFSLDVHAVAVLHQPKEMAPPFWLPALSRDIRKTPTRPLRHSRQASSSTIPWRSSGPSVSSTIAIENSDTNPETSGTLLTPPNEYTDNSLTKPRKSSLTWSTQSKIQRTIEDTWLGGERYWSEFNDEDNEEEPYTILIHPQPSESGVPTGFFGKLSENLKRFFNFEEGLEREPERRPLMSELTHDMSELTHDSSDEEAQVVRRGVRSGYSTFSTEQQDMTERALFRGYCFFFTLSMIIISISGAWAITHSPKKQAGPDYSTGLAETASVLLAAVFAAYAVSLFVARKDNVTMAHKSIVLGLFCVICLAGSLILSIVYINWLRP